MNIKRLLLMAVVVLAFSDCSDDYDDTELRQGLVSALQNNVREMLTALEALDLSMADLTELPERTLAFPKTSSNTNKKWLKR